MFLSQQSTLLLNGYLILFSIFSLTTSYQSTHVKLTKGNKTVLNFFPVITKNIRGRIVPESSHIIRWFIIMKSLNQPLVQAFVLNQLYLH